MKYVITIDTGTTNTRMVLWDEANKAVHSVKSSVGVRNTAIDGNPGKLVNGIRDCLDRLLRHTQVDCKDVKCMIASGMITSELGLADIPHILAPAGVMELAGHIEKRYFPEICSLPVYFIPGIKNCMKEVRWDNFMDMDMMRGEETESVALIKRFYRGCGMVLILPGSHTKFVAADTQGRITGCVTSMAGELLEVITKETILAKAVEGEFVKEKSYDREMVLLGYKTAKKAGVSRACFLGRVLKANVCEEHGKIANYILGAVLQNDIQLMEQSKLVQKDLHSDIIVSGKNPFRRALFDMIMSEGRYGKVTEFIPQEGEMPLSAEGALMIAGAGGII
ncbi:MAG: 2-dehydro-3-deoxygalactonokinase [Lachnospiraceae bacterium]